MSTGLLILIGAAVTAFEILGIVSAIHAVMRARTSQGAIAWAIALITWPFVCVPLFWIFGRSKFQGYASARRAQDSKLVGVIEEMEAVVAPFRIEIDKALGEAKVLERLAHLPFLRGNDAQLLIDGEQTFEMIFDAIDRAEHHVLAEFFIVRDDELGRRFRDRLIGAAKRGCTVLLLYDEVGSRSLNETYLRELRDSGVNVQAMQTTRGITNRFQLNFRNHRKIVVIDGHEAFVGGHNVGEEYVHKHRRLTPWRDTHLRFEGPAAQAAQIVFLEDWHWATDSVPKLKWDFEPAPANKPMFILPSGPADEYETCGLFFTHAINSAEKRVWITSPYFVPDDRIITAMQLAAMRNVDVRLIIPDQNDNWLVKWAASTYLPQVIRAGVKVYEYETGFMHQKVMLLDDNVAVVGTANLDNRSFRLNFEMTAMTIDIAFAGELEEMLIGDFGNSRLIDRNSIPDQNLVERIRGRVARLLSPIL